jgi:riboflavin biosynthesis pyrimidine reductase
VADLPALDVLLPLDRAGSRIEPSDDEIELLGLYNDLIPVNPPRGVHVRANMIATLDGAGTGADHVTGSINGGADWRVFRVLRALADVVLIGAGTARDEKYSPLTVPDELRAVRERIGRRPERMIVATGTSPEHVDLGVALRTLGARGLRHVLAEGGPRLLAELVEAGLVDELCLTWSPRLVGGPAPRILNAESWLEPARDARATHLLHADGVLLGRWQVSRLGA